MKTFIKKILYMLGSIIAVFLVSVLITVLGIPDMYLGYFAVIVMGAFIIFRPTDWDDWTS